MLSSFPIAVIAGGVLGFLAALGVGGGSLLILWLTLVIGESAEIARGINLLFFIPSAVIVCIFRRKKMTISFRKILPAIVAGCIAAALGALARTYIGTQDLRKPFGLILLATGLRELFYRPRNAR